MSGNRGNGGRVLTQVTDELNASIEHSATGSDAMERVLTLVREAISLVNAGIARAFSDVDPDELDAWYDGRLSVGTIDGQFTIVRRVFIRGRKSWTEIDLLARFADKAKPGSALISYFWTISERNAQRLSKAYAQRRQSMLENLSTRVTGRTEDDFDEEFWVHAFKALTADELMAARLWHVDGCSQAIIAVAMGSTRDRVQTILDHAWEKLEQACQKLSADV